MSDEQLRAMARRVRHLVMGTAQEKGMSAGRVISAFAGTSGDEFEYAVMNILREEMGKAKALTRTYPTPTGSPEFQELMRKHMEQQSKDDPFYGIPFNEAVVIDT